MSFAAIVSVQTLAQETSITTSTADTYVRKGNTADNGAKTSIELQTSSAKSTDFVGLMTFSFTQPNDGYAVKSAKLRLTTKRIKSDRGIAVYAFNGDVSESSKYADVEEAIATARTAEPITTFELAGQGNKDIEVDALGDDYKNVSAWTNEIDLTAYVQRLSGNTFSIMLARTADSSESCMIFSKEATDIANGKDASVTAQAADLVPQLVVEYEKNESRKTNSATAVKDTWIRSDNASANNNAKATMEIKSYTDESDETKSRYFYGVMSFSIPSEALNKEKYTVKSASLRLVTERIKGNSTMALYAADEYPEQPKYDDLATAIASVGTATPIATFQMKGEWNKALGIDAIGENYRDISAWTNTIDLTDYVSSLESGSSLNFIIAATQNNNNPGCIYTSDAVDVTNAKDATLTFAAADLKPMLTIVYEATNPSGIEQATTETATTIRQGIYTLQGVKVKEISRPGVYIVNGKKVVKK